jgi:hypothetical protein
MMNPLPLVLPSPLPTPAPSLELGQSLGLELRDLVANPCGWTDADISKAAARPRGFPSPLTC